jgi:cytochrome b561
VPDTARRDGYSRVSIIAHWLAAILVVALFLTHEGERGSTEYAIHVGGGA